MCPAWALLCALRLAPPVQQTVLAPGCTSVRASGAVGDARTDDSAAFQKAIDQAAAVGGTVFVDPVPPGGGYVITRTVVVKQGVSLVGSLAGMPFIAWEGVPRNVQTGPVILARPSADQYTGERKRPLLHLAGGNTLRGLYILYDQQPWPSDQEFDDPRTPFRYANLDELKRRFVQDHVAPCGPTIEIQPGVASTTMEDITCGRYYDFLYTRSGGKIVVRRCYLYGYKRAFALREAKDVVRLSEIHLVPNVEEPISWQHAKLQAAITSQPDNIAFDFGSVDGYSVTDVAAFLVHTGFKLGASQRRPFHDPVTGEAVAFEWGAGPWGSVENAKVDNCVVGFDCVLGTILPNQLANVMVHVSLAPDETFPAASGEAGRQAAFVVEPGFAGATLQISNLSLSSFAPMQVAANGAMVQQANGRAFLVDCPGIGEPKDYAHREQAHIDISGLVVSNIPETHFVAATAGTTPSIRVRGFSHNGRVRDDGWLR